VQPHSSDHSNLYADLAIPVAVDALFTYAVPEDLCTQVRKGMRAVVPFGRRTVIGFVVELKNTTTVRAPKAVVELLDAEPVISEELLDLTRWMASYYVAPWGEVLKTVLVRGSTTAGKRTVRLAAHPTGDGEPSPQQRTIVEHLTRAGSLTIPQLQHLLGRASLHGALGELVRRGIVEIEEGSPGRGPKARFEQVIDFPEASKRGLEAWLGTPEARREGQRRVAAALLALDRTLIPVTEFLKSSAGSLSSLKTLARKGLVAITRREAARSIEPDFYDSALGAKDIVLNAHQRNAVAEVAGAVGTGEFRAFLLHGVTGSGKTQVYIEAIRDALARGKTAIVLVPEISLTPQIVRRFRFHFQERVAVMHSRMSVGERYDTWRAAWEGRCSVVIGPRSAVFAPLKNLGLIVVDEEHEASYKQFDQNPRYHARDVAIVRARGVNAVVLLGTATPSLETYANVEAGKHTLLELPERVDDASLPSIRVVDMTEERKRKFELFRQSRKEEFIADREAARRSKRSFEFGPISDLLAEQIAERLARKEGIILLQNRRGFAPFVECPDCGYVALCEQCNISFTYHLAKKHLRCHYCGSVKPPPEACPDCRSVDIQYRGFGTQRVEEELRRLYPEARILRMDLDTTTDRGSHDRILRTFSEGKADILLGTQMVAKGLDFSRVTLVGVISADTQMLLPDFRSAERTFQLLTQVAGRAGRSKLAGEVVIQTCQPRHYALRHVLAHDFPAFYREEMAVRRELRYPPFSRLVLIEFRAASEQAVIKEANAFALRMKAEPHWTMLGPASAAIPKLKGSFRWHILLKNFKETDPAGQRLHAAIRAALQPRKGGAVRVVIDVDPVGMM